MTQMWVGSLARLQNHSMNKNSSPSLPVSSFNLAHNGEVPANLESGRLPFQSFQSAAQRVAQKKLVLCYVLCHHMISPTVILPGLSNCPTADMLADRI